jgi:hypothetical protein
MRIHAPGVLLTVSALTLPAVAQAQEIPPLLAALALSPIVVFLLVIALGIVTRNWVAGVAHAALVGTWIVLFGIASYWVENDYVIWTPLALYAIHAVVLVVLVVKGALRRGRG